MRYRKPHQRTCQRKVGTLSLKSEDQPPEPYTPGWFLNRVVSGVFETEVILQKLREVHSACSPDRQFVRIKVVDFYASWSRDDTFPWYALDTNQHGYGYDPQGNRFRTNARQKSGGSYKRPGHDLCVEGHVPLIWGYKGQDGYAMYGSLPGAIVKAALSELEALRGGKPEKIEVRVQMVRLRPDEWTSERVFMSWGLPS
jgi:hypothetical protein